MFGLSRIGVVGLGIVLALGGCGYRSPSAERVMVCQDVTGDDGGGAAFLDCVHGGRLSGGGRINVGQ
jgi:hypothetical protein